MLAGKVQRRWPFLWGQENAASNRVAQKCGGKIVSESTYKKRGTDMVMKDYKYEIVL